MPKISVVILSYNRNDELSKNLECLLAGSQTGDFEIIAVDNGSTDGSAETLRRVAAEWPNVKIVLNKTNLGVAGGRNIGFKMASGQYVVCLDDDSSFDPAKIPLVTQAFESMPKAGILAFRVWNLRNNLWCNDYGWDDHLVSHFHGSGHAFRKSLFDKIGMLDEQCTYGAEELDYSIRAHNAGYDTIFTPYIIVHHNGRSLQSGADMERRSQFIYNFVRILHKNFPNPLASELAQRCTMLHLFKAIKAHGPFCIPQFLSASNKGRRDGIAGQKLVNDATVRFYANPNLLPFYGNSSLILRAWRRIARTVRRKISTADPMEITATSPTYLMQHVTAGASVEPCASENG